MKYEISWKGLWGFSNCVSLVKHILNMQFKKICRVREQSSIKLGTSCPHTAASHV